MSLSKHIFVAIDSAFGAFALSVTLAVIPQSETMTSTGFAFVVFGSRPGCSESHWILSALNSSADRLLRGNIPGEMEDKWFVYVDGDEVFFHRSWTGQMIFWGLLERGDFDHRIRSLWASRDRSVYNWTGAADDLEAIEGILRSRFGLEDAVLFDGRR